MKSWAAAAHSPRCNKAIMRRVHCSRIECRCLMSPTSPTPDLSPAASLPSRACSSPECAACHSDLQQMLAAGDLCVRFRPVAELARCGIWGHIASISPATHALPHSPQRLVAVARAAGQLPALAGAFFAGAVRRYAEAGKPGTLLLSLRGWEDDCHLLDLHALLQPVLDAHGLASTQLMLVHAGCTPASAAPEATLRWLQAARSVGFGVAAHGLGCDYSEQRLWSLVAPELVIADARAIADLEMPALSQSRFASLIARERDRGRQVLLSAVDSLAAWRALVALGITHAAGDFIGRDNALPSTIVSAAASKLMREHSNCGLPGGSCELPVLERLLVATPPARVSDSAVSVFMRFERDKETQAIAVLRDERPVGLISRFDMVENMARPFRQEVYGRKPCTRFMDDDPLIVDIGLSLQELSELIVHAHPRHLVSGFIIVSGGRYLGVGSARDLMREVTAMQMEAARYANPLTELPGNVPINKHIDSLLGNGEWCAIGYCDLDNFKPFNDVYGYAKGDAVIRLCGRILADSCDEQRDFLGHIGGDDFILVFRSEDWRGRCEQALARFAQEIRGFFSDDDLELGGYVTENRKGQPEFHSVTSLSIGIVEALPGMFASHLSVARVATEVKKKAKAIAGNSLYVNQRAYHDDESERDTGRGSDDPGEADRR
ncbi:hypothetical protein CKO20_01065 [Rhodocyclus tenuis]|nr:hypothetical protein [Rhodocyclus tenuis]